MRLEKNHIHDYLLQSFVMQLATVGEYSKPWVCSVYFVDDNDLNLYWLSLPERRHSKELEQNPKCAVTMAIKQDLPVIGLGAEGLSSIVEDEKTVEEVMKKYYQKYKSGEKFYQKFLAGENNHVMYKFVPEKYVLFDEVDFNKDVSVDFYIN